MRLQLVELIRATITTNGAELMDVTPCLDFATKHLAPRAPADPAFLQDLEQTMALLCFPPDAIAPQLAYLLRPDLRRVVANAVNATLLMSLGERDESSLKGLVQLWDWGERRLRAENVEFPGLRLDAGDD